MNDLRIHSALDCRICPHDSDLPVSGRLDSSTRPRYDNPHYRDVEFIPHSVKCERARRIARDHDRFDILCLQETDDLLREADDRILRFASVWDSRCIPEIYDIFIRELTGDLSYDRQPTYAGIKHTYRCCIPVLHNNLLSPVTLILSRSSRRPSDIRRTFTLSRSFSITVPVFSLLRTGNRRLISS